MSGARTKGRWMIWTAATVVLLALALFGAWRWAASTGSAGTLDWIDARFWNDPPATLVETAQYGSDPAQTVELWVPRGQSFAEPAPPPGQARPIVHPLVVFIHGGGWHLGAPAEYRFVARTLADQGFAVALVGYRLVPGGRFPAMLEDSAAAVRWLRDNGARHGARIDRVVLMGHSAGAYNALMLGLDAQWLESAGVPQEAIAGVVSLAGPADFYPWTRDSSRNAMGHAPDPRATQPITFARADAPPILLLHGTADDVVRPRNSRRLAEAIAAAGGPVRKVEFAGMGHAGIVMGLSKPFAQGGKVRDPILRFLRETAAAPAPRPVGASVPVQGESR